MSAPWSCQWYYLFSYSGYFRKSTPVSAIPGAGAAPFVLMQIKAQFVSRPAVQTNWEYLSVIFTCETPNRLPTIICCTYPSNTGAYTRAFHSTVPSTIPKLEVKCTRVCSPKRRLWTVILAVFCYIICHWFTRPPSSIHFPPTLSQSSDLSSPALRREKKRPHPLPICSDLDVIAANTSESPRWNGAHQCEQRLGKGLVNGGRELGELLSKPQRNALNSCKEKI